MNVLFTFRVKDHQKERLLNTFPEVTFHFEVTDEAIANAHIIASYGSDINIPFLEKAKRVKWLMIASAGIENMPLSYIAKRELIVTNARGIHKTPMAESVLAYVLSIRRSLFVMKERQQKKEWNKKVPSKEVKGSTALILGPGAIGGEVGRLLQAFGVYTIGCSRTGSERKWMDEMIVLNQLPEKLGDADFVISVLPSTSETAGLLTKDHFQAMKETAVFMNFGRGDLCKEETITEALKNGEIAYAVVDVFEEEPLPANSELWELENIFISPHASSFSGLYVERALDIFEENLEKWLNGDKNLRNLIKVEREY